MASKFPSSVKEEEQATDEANESDAIVPCESYNRNDVDLRDHRWKGSKAQEEILLGRKHGETICVIFFLCLRGENVKTFFCFLEVVSGVCGD